MSGVKPITFKGTLNWAKVQEPETADDGKSASYSVEVECTQAQYDAIIKYGVSPLTKLKEKDDGKTYVNVKKKAWAIYDGEKKQYGGVRILDKNKQALTALVGNGSKGAVIAELIKTPKSKFTKAKMVLHTVVVQDLVEYTPGQSYDDIVDGLTESAPFDPDSTDDAVDAAFM